MIDAKTKLLIDRLRAWNSSPLSFIKDASDIEIVRAALRFALWSVGAPEKEEEEHGKS